MFLKSVWNLFLVVFLTLPTWSYCFSIYLPQMEFATMIGKPVSRVHSNRELKPLLSKLMDNVREIYDLVEANQMNQEQLSRNSELEFNNHVLMRAIEKLTNDRTEIDKLIEMRTELKSELTANVAAVKNLKSELATMIPSNQQIFGFFTIPASGVDEVDSELNAEIDDLTDLQGASATDENEAVPESETHEEDSESNAEIDDLNDLQGASETNENEAVPESEAHEEDSESNADIDYIFHPTALYNQDDLQAALETNEDEDSKANEDDSGSNTDLDDIFEPTELYNLDDLETDSKSKSDEDYAQSIDELNEDEHWEAIFKMMELAQPVENYI